MTARSIASLNLAFGLVSIPVKLYSATESSASVHFHLLSKDGARLKQHYVSEKTGKEVPRSEMVRGFEVEKDSFVVFTSEELKQLEESSDPTIEIVSFIPEKSVDPLYYDKAYLLAPDKRGAKPYALLREAMRESHRCALAKWSWKTRQHVVQIRPSTEGLVLQQLFYADEVRSLADLDIDRVKVSPPELKLALQLIEQISTEAYDPAAFEDEEKKRVLAAIEEKVAGQEIVATAGAAPSPAAGGKVIDLMAALQASLGKKPAGSADTKSDATTDTTTDTKADTPTDASTGPKKAAKNVTTLKTGAPRPAAKTAATSAAKTAAKRAAKSVSATAPTKVRAQR